MIKFVLIGAAFAGILYLVWRLTPASEWKRCPKCNGKGFWRGTRGESQKCDMCQGYGKTPRVN